MHNISYPNFNNNSFCYNNQVMQNSRNVNKNNKQSFGENVKNEVTTQNQNHKTVYVPTQVPNGNGSGVNIIIYNPAVVPGNNTTFNNHYTQSPTLNTQGENQNAHINSQVEAENQVETENENIYDNMIEDSQDIKNEEPDKTDGASQSLEENKYSFPTENEVKEEKVETKEITLLTDEYIMNLENYLRNENKDIRTQGIEMLAKCFREDKTRSEDVALTNLLNLALQDVEPRIRILAMCLLDTKDAKGDDLTYDILTKLQASTAYGGEEAKLASKVLLEMNTEKVQVTENEVDNGK